MSEFFDKLQHLSRWQMFCCGILAILFASTIFLLLQMQSADPLTRATGLHGRIEVKADYITAGGVNAYDGPRSASLQSCVALHQSKGRIRAERVRGKFDQLASIVQTRTEIINELDAVFGHAVRNGQINWIWDGTELEYDFIVAPGDEFLWNCYLREETQFFSEFLKEVKEEFLADAVENVVVTSNDDFTEFTFTWDPSEHATSYQIQMTVGAEQPVTVATIEDPLADAYTVSYDFVTDTLSDKFPESGNYSFDIIAQNDLNAEHLTEKKEVLVSRKAPAPNDFSIELDEQKRFVMTIDQRNAVDLDLTDKIAQYHIVVTATTNGNSTNETFMLNPAAPLPLSAVVDADQYQVTIRAEHKAPNYQLSDPTTKTFDFSSPEQLTVPTNVYVTVEATTTDPLALIFAPVDLRVSWDAVANADEYVVEYRKQGAVSFTPLVATTNELVIEDLPNDAAYEVRVTAESASSQWLSSDSSEIASVVIN